MIQTEGFCSNAVETVKNGGFPGGAIEIGETPEMAAVREIKEETGLAVKASGLIGIYTDCDMEYPNGGRAQSICIVYELEVTGGQSISNTWP